MRGLDAEFERFRGIALVDVNDEEVANIKTMFLAGAFAASDRFLSILYGPLPPKRKLALFRRIDREMQVHQQAIIEAAKRAEGTE